MKRLLFIAACYLCTITGCWAQEHPNKEVCSLTEIYNQWKNVPIKNVVNGSLGIMLERFDQTWPTLVVGDVREVMEQGLESKLLDEETDYRIINDAKNGYVGSSDAGTDSEYMSACVWNRSNGHRLLAVHLGKPTDPEIDFVCFYDYNPQTKTLTPEPTILSDFKRKSASSQISHKLPRQGKSVIIQEFEPPFVYTNEFKWDGMKPVFLKTTAEDWDSYFNNNGIPVKFSGKKPTISDFVNAFIAMDDSNEALGEMAQNWKKHLKGQPLPKGKTFIVDTNNGYIRYESKPYGQGPHAMEKYFEFCYWNCADGKHKLVAENLVYFCDGTPCESQFSGITFYMYDNATRKMETVYAGNLGINIEPPSGTYATARRLPRTGKTIELDYLFPAGKITKKLTWNGSKFIEE